jgi:hypothetical protein
VLFQTTSLRREECLCQTVGKGRRGGPLPSLLRARWPTLSGTQPPGLGLRKSWSSGRSIDAAAECDARGRNLLHSGIGEESCGAGGLTGVQFHSLLMGRGSSGPFPATGLAFLGSAWKMTGVRQPFSNSGTAVESSRSVAFLAFDLGDPRFHQSPNQSSRQGLIGGELDGALGGGEALQFVLKRLDHRGSGE